MTVRRIAFCLGAAVLLVSAGLFGSACGGGPRSATTDLAAIRQPTPDPTLDAVVRDLPRALAGVAAPTATPTMQVVGVPKPAVPKPATKAPTTAPERASMPKTAVTPTPKPAPRQPTATAAPTSVAARR